MKARRRAAPHSAGGRGMTLATGRRELERWLTGAAFNAYFGFRLGELELGAGKCTIEAPFRDQFERPGGAICGPVFMAAADVASWFAVATLRCTTEPWVTADLKTAFLRAARREPFTCTARVLKIGRQLAYVVAECARQDGAPLTHHTAIYVRIPDERGHLGQGGKRR